MLPLLSVWTYYWIVGKWLLAPFFSGNVIESIQSFSIIWEYCVFPEAIRFEDIFLQIIFKSPL